MSMVANLLNILILIVKNMKSGIEPKRTALPDIRRARLKRLLEIKPIVNAIEVHNGLQV